ETAKQSNMQAGQNLTLTTETLRGQGEISAGSDVTVKASHLSFYGGKLKAGNQVLLQGEQNLTVRDADISGHDIALISSGGVSVSSGGSNSPVAGARAFSTISAANMLHILSEQGISLSNTLINRAKNIFLASKGEIEISLSPYLAKFNGNQSSTDSDVLNDDAQRELISQRLRQFSQLEADENIEIHAGAGVNLRGISLTAGKDITLTSGNSLDVGKVITANNKDTETTKLTAKQGGISLTASGKAALGDVQAKTDITVNGKDIEAAKLTAEQGSISLTANGKATLGDVQAKTDITVNGKDIETTKLTAEQGSISLTANGRATLGDVQAKTDITVNGKDIETTKLTAKQGGISLTASGKAALGDVQAKTDITVNGK
ncbi:hypothetical protein C6H66_25030, partial [Photorhabdus hindustanensis]